MKKRLIAIIMVLAIALSVISGCGIIVKNNERDLAQIVAEVGYTEGQDGYVLRQKDSAGEYIAGKKKLTKRDLVIAFMNNGYSLVQQGMSVEDAIKSIMDQLVWTEIVIQEAVRVLAKEAGITGTPKVEDCITTKELAEIEREVYDVEFEQINKEYDAIRKDKGLDEIKPETDEEPDHNTHEHETTDRATQNKVATATEEYVSKYDKSKEPVNDDNWKAAIKKYEVALDGNEKGLTREKYYAKMVNSQMENKVIKKFQEKVEKEALSAWLKGVGVDYLTDAGLAQKYYTDILMANYNDDKEVQKAKYENKPAAFLAAMENETNILYIPNQLKATDGHMSEYFYVKNLLVKVSDAQQKELDRISALPVSDSMKEGLRLEVLNQVVAEDLRNVFEYNDTTIYQGETKYSQAGKILRRSAPSAVEFPSYMAYTGENSVKADFDAEKFYDEDFGEYLLKDAKTANANYYKQNVKTGTFYTDFKAELAVLSANTDYKASAYYDKTKTATENAFATLIYKYGNDPGMFNNEKDYLVKPYAPGVADTYVLSFSTAARKGYASYIANSGSKEDKQLASMELVQSEFGWHIIIVTDVVKEKTFESNYVEILNATKNLDGTTVTGWEKSFVYTYNKTIQDEVKSSAYSTEQTRVIEQFMAKAGFVTKFEKTYKDLLKLN